MIIGQMNMPEIRIDWEDHYGDRNAYGDRHPVNNSRNYTNTGE